ncbi:adenine phosphoribosyltransferase [Plasmopara halstedii]|uniref:Adenine phosphoribosyltransferase n=1 Tax=Plasmopara halstedii TaxID=4781 RepID=A0A0P1ARH5_PLAHL|nr:adenine phosphoribosyltransferase [Plasmopara halstedii]CEG43757.1 adenine phosphoribosyltransferase [Plasmopara halstedii]|eukprot:XP_024580126.1 adenine phosphoribosyltransferase [Plasmopara halstedii]
MLRKLDKIPSVKDTVEYSKEYKGDNTNGGDCLGIQDFAVDKEASRGLCDGLHICSENSPVK